MSAPGSAPAPSFDAIEARFGEWARTRPDIRAAIVVGSRARTDRPADRWSDLDIAVITRRPADSLAGEDWVGRIGPYHITFLEPTAIGTLERRVLFEGGLDVDFSPVPLAAVRAVAAYERLRRRRPALAALVPRGLRRRLEAGGERFGAVLRRGYRVILDKDGLAPALELVAAAAPAPPKLPTRRDYDNEVSDFWYHAVWTVRKLSRGELLVAKACCDGYMKRILHRAIEAHAVAVGGSADAWHDGRFLDERAAPWIVAGLRSAYARYDREDVARALLATMGLFRRVAVELGQALGYPYPHGPDAYATALVHEHLAHLGLPPPGGP